MVAGTVFLMPAPPPPPPNIGTAPAGFFFCGFAGSVTTSGLPCDGSPPTFPLSVEAAKRSSAAVVCFVLGAVGGRTDSLGCLAVDEGLVVNNPSSSDWLSERRSNPGLDDYSSKRMQCICMYVVNTSKPMINTYYTVATL